MEELGWSNEANFCRTIRQWYAAEDEPCLSVTERLNLRMNMRKMLLSTIKLAEFPPPGMHIGGMPMVMFEGILTNIDRRLQLHAIIPEHACNVRAPNSLDVENLFSGFQELDPKSTGVLLADDVPYALETASYLVQMRLKPKRSFVMRTSRASSVYPANMLHQDGLEEVVEDDTQSSLPLNQLYRIPLVNHRFDLAERRSVKPKRKKAYVPDFDQPSRGTLPVRQYHKSDSSKILAHIRHGLKDDML